MPKKSCGTLGGGEGRGAGRGRKGCEIAPPVTCFTRHPECRGQHFRKPGFVSAAPLQIPLLIIYYRGWEFLAFRPTSPVPWSLPLPGQRHRRADRAPVRSRSSPRGWRCPMTAPGHSEVARKDRHMQYCKMGRKTTETIGA